MRVRRASAAVLSASAAWIKGMIATSFTTTRSLVGGTGGMRTEAARILRRHRDTGPLAPEPVVMGLGARFSAALGNPQGVAGLERVSAIAP
jgi:hypothetical protein